MTKSYWATRLMMVQSDPSVARGSPYGANKLADLDALVRYLHWLRSKAQVAPDVAIEPRK